MIKRLMSRAVPEEEWPVWGLPLAILAGFLISGLLFYLFYFGPGIRDLQGLAYAPSDSEERVRIEVGGTLFSVPAHYTRNGRTRRGGTLAHASLHALLPTLNAWRKDRADGFLDTGIASNLLTVNIRAATRNLPDQRVFNAIYRPYIAGSGQVNDDGLQGYNFRSDSPYGQKQIFRGLKTGSAAEREIPPLFVCDVTQHENPTCESRFNLGNSAQVSYVFKRIHLAQWENIDRNVREMIRNFRAEARRQN
ncbi:MAG: hypothetical protein ACR2OK_02190 [Parvibaculales bacterium]